MNPLFESLVVNNLTILADEPDDSTAMVLSEAETQEELENNEKAIYRLDLNDKEVLPEEIEDLMAFKKTQKVKDLRLDKNEFFDEGVELLVKAPALKKLLTLSLAYNKLTDNAIEALASSEILILPSGVIVERSKQTVPSEALIRAPFSPKKASVTSFVSGTELSITSTSLHASAGEEKIFIPCCSAFWHASLKGS